MRQVTIWWALINVLEYFSYATSFTVLQVLVMTPPFLVTLKVVLYVYTSLITTKEGWV